jgi:hypothetical protein
VIDDSFAICGGIDMTGDRWDKPAHMPTRSPAGSAPTASPTVPGTTSPWRSTARLPARWPSSAATAGAGRPARSCRPRPARRLWPDELEPQFTAAASPSPAPSRPSANGKRSGGRGAVHRRDRKRPPLHLHREPVFHLAPIAAAIMRRMEAPDPPEIVLVTPITADGWLEQVAMDATRLRLMKIIGAADPDNRFRIFTPKTKGGQDIYVHAKVMIVDDRLAEDRLGQHEQPQPRPRQRMRPRARSPRKARSGRHAALRTG